MQTSSIHADFTLARRACDDHRAYAYGFVAPAGGPHSVPANLFAQAIRLAGDTAVVFAVTSATQQNLPYHSQYRVFGVSKVLRERPVRCVIAGRIRAVVATQYPDAASWGMVPSIGMLDTCSDDYCCDAFPFAGVTEDRTGAWEVVNRLEPAAVPTVIEGKKLSDTPMAMSAKKLMATFTAQREASLQYRLMHGAPVLPIGLATVAAELGLHTIEQPEDWPGYRLVRSPKTGQPALVIHDRRWWLDLSTGLSAVGADSPDALRMYAAQVQAPVCTAV